MLRLIVLGESDLYFRLLSDLRAHKLLLKSRNESAGANGQRIVFTLAALKSHAIYKSLKIQRSHIAVLHGTVVHRDISGIVLPLPFNRRVNLFVSHRSIRFIHFYALVLAKLYLWLDRNRGREDKGLTRLNLGYLNLGRGNDIFLALVKSLIVRVGNQYIRRLLEKDFFAVHSLYHLAGHLALAETGYADSALLLLISFLDGLFKLLHAGLDRQLRHVLL